MSSTLKLVLATVVAYAERYALPWLFFYFAWKDPIWRLPSIPFQMQNGVFPDIARHLILVLLNIFTGAMLLLARRPVSPPQKLRFILIPLVATFFTFFYNQVRWFPLSCQANLAPPVWQKPLFFAGLTCLIIGLIIQLWGILHLRRSFGICVMVRKVVLTGPYRWVRHPMYVGAIFLCLGAAIANCSFAYFFLVAIHISLLLYRAHLEETQLAAHSVEYQEHMKRTGFIFPKFRSRSVAG